MDQEPKQSKDKKKMRFMTMRLGDKEIAQARIIAQKKGIGYQTLLRMWIIEAIEREQKKSKE